MVVTKEKLVHLAPPGTVDEFLYQSVGDFALAEIAAAEIGEGFGVLFVHFAGPDAGGHLYGWMSESYLGTVHNTDIAVARLLEALDAAGLTESTLVILTADHGGHGTIHGTDLLEDTTIPWIVAGPGVIPGLSLQTPVRVFDTAATAAWALGLPLPGDMDGAPVLEAFGR
jgi:phosphopentomutase